MMRRVLAVAATCALCAVAVSAFADDKPGAGAPANEDAGTSSFKWILGGRFIQQDVSGTSSMPDPTGKMQKLPFHGMGLMGFDNFRNMYTSMWVDDMGTMMMTQTGSAQPGGKTINMYGEMDEPGMKVVGRMVRSVIEWVDNDHFTYTMYDLHASPDYKVMQISYARKKA